MGIHQIMLKSVKGGVIYRLAQLLQFIINHPRFKQWGWGSRLKNPLIITPYCISVGRYVNILPLCRIQGIRKKNSQSFNPNIIIEDEVSIQQGLHLTCADSITIGHNTAIAANVTITDINHPYTNPDIPIEQQDLEVKPVKIGRNSKIYNNAVILPGVHIGNHVTIGANSVVNKSIPDYCVAVGIPAIIVKKYNFETQQWEKTDKLGNFIKQ